MSKATIPAIPLKLDYDLKKFLEPIKEMLEVRSGRRPTAAASFPADLGPNPTNAQIAVWCNQLKALLLS